MLCIPVGLPSALGTAHFFKKEGKKYFLIAVVNSALAVAQKHEQAEAKLPNKTITDFSDYR